MAEAKARSCGGGEIKRHWSRFLLDRCGAIGTVLRSTRPVRSVRCGSSDWSSVCSCSPFLSVSLSLFVRLKLGPKMVSKKIGRAHV